MATVEQRDTQSSGLTALSSTLDIFNDFKDDKDSDEESFHLPLLDCDDDLDSNNKDTATTEDMNTSDLKDTHCPNGESEDDILNKFETNGTPDIDPKIEDKLLDDSDDLCENKLAEKSVEIDSTNKVITEEAECIDEKQEISEEAEYIDEKQEISEEAECIDEKHTIDISSQQSLNETKELDDSTKQAVEEPCIDAIETQECLKSNTDETVKEELNDQQQEIDAQNSTEEDHLINGTEKMEIDDQKVILEEELPKQDEIKNETDQSNTDTEITSSLANNTTTTHINDNRIQEAQENSEDRVEETNIKNNSNDAPMDENVKANLDVENISQTECEKDKMVHHEEKEVQDENVTEELNNQDTVDEEQSIQMENKLSEEVPVEPMETETVHDEAKVISSQEFSPQQLEGTSKNSENIESSKSENILEAVDTQLLSSNDEKHKSNENNIDASKENRIDDTSECEKINLLENDSGEVHNADSNHEELNEVKQTTVLEESIKQKENDHSKTETVEPDKCENSNDSSKSQNLDCDDLLDISIIRDADEDNASAIAENANDAHSNEKSDNDDQDEESEKADNELDESEMDQEESLLNTDKDDQMDFEDGNSSNLVDQENMVNGITSDSENKEDTEMGDSESNSNVSSVLNDKNNKINGSALDSEISEIHEVRVEQISDTVKATGLGDQDAVKENSPKLGGKRSLSLSEPENAEETNKKIKLSENAVLVEKKKPSKKIKTLITFEKFMQNKKLENKLTRSDLEQFCLQKICEAIIHKTEVGELHQTIKKQEQIIENLRKDLQQLTKQTRDLDIVNKKLMNELRAQNGIKKPLVPLKITRSVGLQVKLNLNIDNNSRRKTPITTNPRTPNASNPPRQRAITPANAGVVRQVAAASPVKTPTSTTPLLSQALQNNRQISPANTTKRPPIRAKPAEPQKPNNPGVIDLTDEDDKASKAATGTPVKVVRRTVPLSQTKTVNIVPNKTTPNKTTNTNTNQNKTIAVGQVKNSTITAKVGTPGRTVTTLPQGVRLTPTQVKNGSITIPASVVTSSAGTTQLMYVVQPTSSLGQVVTSTAGGTQKAVLLNFQPTNGVLTSALNGSAVSVIPTKTTNTVQLKTVAVPRKHPAPLPTPPSIAVNSALKPLLPKPHLSIRKTDTGIILQWRMPYNLDIYEGIASYQLFAYQETNAAPSTDMWRKVGDVKALALPMACTLTQFADKNKYYFAVRSVDVHKRIGAFSDPEEISL